MVCSSLQGIYLIGSALTSAYMESCELTSSYPNQDKAMLILSAI